MLTQPQRRERLAFGPFEVDLRSAELFKNGILIRLPGQPFRILVALLENAGELVTREQLRQLIWRDGTNVDFEHSLNVAVNRLRRALCDSADEPRYIETVPGKGYRFIQTVEGGAPKVEPTAATADALITAEAGDRRKRRWWTASGRLAALLVFIGIGGAVFLRPHRTPPFGGTGTLVLAGFRNTTGDPVFDTTLQQGLGVQLQQSPFLSIVAENRVRQTLRLMERPGTDFLTAELAREVCERTGSSAVVEGSIGRLGSRYVLGLSAKSCDGNSLYVEQVQAPQKENVLDAVSEIARKFRQGAGESLAVIRQHDTPLAEATTASLDALKAYSKGRELALSASFSSGVPLLQRAIELDPRFAMAHAFLGRVYSDVGDSALAAESTRRAYEFRDRASEQERFFISFSYDRQITGNLQSAQRTLTLWEQTYPREAAPHSLMSGYTSQGMGRYETTIAEAKKTIELDPDATPAYLNLAFDYTLSNQFKEAEATLGRARKRNLEIPDSLILAFYLAYFRNDRESMDRIAARLKGQPEEDWMLQSEALVAAHGGACTWPGSCRGKQQKWRSVQAILNELPFTEQGRRRGEHCLGMWRRQEGTPPLHSGFQMLATLIMDRRSHFFWRMTLRGAQALATNLAKRFSEDTLVQFTYFRRCKRSPACSIVSLSKV